MSLSRARWSFTLVLAGLLLVFISCRSTKSPSPGAPGATNQTEPRLDSSPTPQTRSFDGQIERVSMYPVPGRPSDLAVTLVVSVHNSGPSSLVKGWNLEVASPSRKVPTILDPVHISGYVELPGTKGPKVDLAKEDLVNKTAQSPIPQGTTLKGVLTFILTKTSESEVSGNRTTFAVTFTDAQGTAYQTRKYAIGSKVQNVDSK